MALGAFEALLKDDDWKKLSISNLLLPRFGPSKSIAYDREATTNALAGKEISHVWVDEWFSPPKAPAISPDFSYENDVFPAAKVDIFAVEGDAHDPRNPNPAAGRRRFWIIKIGERRVGGEYASLAFAKAAAAPMHARVVEALLAHMQKANPNYARF
ncbi:hypothetical protein [Shinella zoogloeoides]|uniref:hypothetical protein n=1 Tax=Shinella zoogloeoides TaxID=352475 RepID=UPI00273D5EE9|nr:hypothetical protein [Shinella zoogloeoides]WLR90936.1 hypothetical protein Q9316_00735 [Shinella zoogloeoides]